MPKAHHPRRGSMQYWPRKRAKRIYPRIKTWPKLDSAKLPGFLGYKAGMTHILVRDSRPTSITKNQTISIPVTVIECPPLKLSSLRFYKNTVNGLKLISEFFNQKTSKELLRKIKPSKKQNESKEFDILHAVIYSQPSLTGIGRKKPELFEINIPGKTNEEKLNFAKSLLEKEIKISEVFKEFQLVDVHAVSKGKGFQGPIKRFGVKTLSHKSEKTKRGVGCVGPWHPHKSNYRVPHAGQMGYHTRTEYNKLVTKISNDISKINPKSGFVRYGLIKSDYLLLKGSVPGSVKRPIIITEPARANKRSNQLQITYISQDSKQ